jgi:hypothetical protein
MSIGSSGSGVWQVREKGRSKLPSLPHAFSLEPNHPSAYRILECPADRDQSCSLGKQHSRDDPFDCG